MNECKYLVMAFLLTLFINISFVKADCTNEEIAKLKDSCITKREKALIFYI